MRYERFIAARHLMATRHTFLNTLTMLAVAGVALGVAAFITVVSVAGGFVDSFKDRVLGVNPHIVVTRFGVYFSEYPTVSQAIADIDGVEGTAPFIIREMLVTRPGSTARPGALVKGVDVASLTETSDLERMVTHGELASLEYTTPIVTDAQPDGVPAGAALGRILAERLGCEVGDVLTLVSPLRGLRSLGIDAGDSGANFARVRVSAIIDSGFFDYDNRLILMDYRAVQDLMGMGDVVMGVEVRVQDPDQTAAIRAQIDARLTTGRFKTLDWREINRNLFSSLELQRLALTIVMSILVVVASSVILCVLVMLVIEKRREIAILRSMGATAGGIMRIFVIQGMTIGGLGTVIGLVLGFLVCHLLGAVEFPLAYEVYRVRSLPVSIRPWEFARAAAGALLICFLATLYPSGRAAKVSPVEALRYD